MKYCNKCDKWKEENEFSINNKTKDRLSNYCKKCEVNRVKKWKSNNLDKVKSQKKRYKNNNPTQIRKEKLKYKYNITINDYNDMLIQQKECCAICHKL